MFLIFSASSMPRIASSRIVPTMHTVGGFVMFITVNDHSSKSNVSWLKYLRDVCVRVGACVYVMCACVRVTCACTCARVHGHVQ